MAKIQLRQLLTNAGHGDRPILAVAKDKSMAQMNACKSIAYNSYVCVWIAEVSNAAQMS